MQDTEGSVQSIDAYIAGFPEDIQERLKTIRATIKAAAPEAEERIAYGMPTFAQHGNLVYFGAAKHHIGFYPTPSGIKAFADELALYPGSKGAVRFPLDQPLPLDLIRRIVEYRVAENQSKAAAKAKKKTKTSE